jgi:hypothetical protein
VRQQIDSWDSKVSTQVGFIREKRKTPLEMDREPGKSVPHCCLHRGVFIWSFLLGRGVTSQGWSDFLTYLFRNIYSSAKTSCLLALWHFEENHDF